MNHLEGLLYTGFANTLKITGDTQIVKKLGKANRKERDSKRFNAA